MHSIKRKPKSYRPARFAVPILDALVRLAMECRQHQLAVIVLEATALRDNLDRLCEPSAHMIFWFPIKHYAKGVADCWHWRRAVYAVTI